MSQEILKMAVDAVANTQGPEEAVAAITTIAMNHLGNRDAHLQPGNLKEGEKDQYACGAFLLLPGDEKQVLIGAQNYGPDQTHMIVGTDIGHPGWVNKHKKELLLESTEGNSSFVKILATFHAGSAIYAPMIWKNQYLGQIICAAQARNVMRQSDLDLHCTLARLAAVAWIAHDGPDYLQQFT